MHERRWKEFTRWVPSAIANQRHNDDEQFNMKLRLVRSVLFPDSGGGILPRGY